MIHDPGILRLFPVIETMKARRLNLPVAWLITSVLSIAIAVGGYANEKAEDCKPGQIDGQCRLSTFVGLLYGAGNRNRKHTEPDCGRVFGNPDGFFSMIT